MADSTIAERGPAPAEAAEPAALTSIIDEADEVIPSDHLGAEKHWTERFDSESDLYAFSRRLLEAARAGNPSSQFLLYHTVEYCKDGYRLLKNLETSELLHRLSPTTPAGNIRNLTDRSTRCTGFYDAGFDEFSERQTLLAIAAESGYPPAMFQVAMRQVGKKQVTYETIDLIVRSIESGDPEVLLGLWQLAPFAVLDERVANALLLAACQFGMDCTEKNKMLKRFCSGSHTCAPGETVHSYFIKTLGQYEYDLALAEAEAITSEIAAGRINESRFDWSGLMKRAKRDKPGNGGSN